MENTTLEISRNRKPLEQVIKGLQSDSQAESRESGLRLINNAKQANLSLRDYLKLAVDKSKLGEGFRVNGTPVNGYDAVKIALNLPVRNEFEEGVVLQAASESFQTFAGVRALFPEVIDDMVRYAYRQDSIADRPETIHSQRRTVAAPHMISTVVPDKEADYQRNAPIAETAKVPVHSIRASDVSVRFYKHGMGYEVSYEFMRRANLDMLTPYVIRANRERGRSETKALVTMLINGDGVHSAATEVDQSTFNGGSIGNSTNGQLSYKHFLKWLVTQAKDGGAPIDTVVGNYDAYLEWLMLFALPATSSSDPKSAAERLAATGYNVGGTLPGLSGTVNFALASDAPAGKLIGFNKAETIETLEETGSNIAESERLIQNQVETYISTVNSGPRLVFGDTRSIYDFGA